MPTICAVIDYETLGLRSDCVVLSVGLAAFDIEKYEPDILQFRPNSMYTNIQRAGQQHRSIDPSTEKWWEGQSEAARSMAFRDTPGMTLKETVIAINTFLLENEVTKLIGNGKEFDNLIYRSMCEDVGIEPVIPFWEDIDLRTMNWLSWKDKPLWPSHLIQHVADHDAIFEAFAAQVYYHHLKRDES